MMESFSVVAVDIGAKLSVSSDWPRQHALQSRAHETSPQLHPESLVQCQSHMCNTLRRHQHSGRVHPGRGDPGQLAGVLPDARACAPGVGACARPEGPHQLQIHCCPGRRLCARRRHHRSAALLCWEKYLQALHEIPNEDCRSYGSLTKRLKGGHSVGVARLFMLSAWVRAGSQVTKWHHHREAVVLGQCVLFLRIFW